MESTNTKKTEFVERAPKLWYQFSIVMIVLCGVALLGSALFSISEEEWSIFLYTLASCAVVLFLCAIVQLLVKIELNTRK